MNETICQIGFAMYGCARSARPDLTTLMESRVEHRNYARWSGAGQGGPRGVQVMSSSSYYINNRQPNGSMSNVLSRLAVVVRVDGDELELELEGVGPSSSILYYM